MVAQARIVQLEELLRESAERQAELQEGMDSAGRELNEATSEVAALRAKVAFLESDDKILRMRREMRRAFAEEKGRLSTLAERATMSASEWQVGRPGEPWGACVSRWFGGGLARTR